MPIIATLFRASFVAFLQSTIRHKDSVKARKARSVVMEIRDACNQFLEVFGTEE